VEVLEMTQNTLIAFLVSLVLGFSGGWSAKGWYVDSKELSVKKAEEVIEAKKEEQIDKVTDQHEKDKEEARVVYRTITKTVDKIVEKPVYLNQCFEEEGLEQINKALK
jgi:hypothetical protein